MEAQKKFCGLILRDPNLLGELVKKIGGKLTLQGINSALVRESPSIRRSLAMVETLREAGYKDSEILEEENEYQCSEIKS